MKLLALLFAASSILCAQNQPPNTPLPPQTGVTSVTGPHQATLNWSNATCTNTAYCNLQVYRATCTSASTCPTYVAGNSSWTALNMTTNLTANAGPSGTTWQYVDKDTALQDSTTYVWVATNTYQGATTASPASTNYSGTTNNGIPPAPTVSSSGNSVN